MREREMERTNNFIATQTANGFKIIFNDTEKNQLEFTFEDINQFAYKYSQAQLSGKELELTEKDELMLSIWEMVLIPDHTIH
jgi:hypothetical protein